MHKCLLYPHKNTQFGQMSRNNWDTLHFISQLYQKSKNAFCVILALLLIRVCWMHILYVHIFISQLPNCTHLWAIHWESEGSLSWPRCSWRYTVYPKKYAHGFVVLCFVVVMQSFIMNPHEVFIHIHQGCFAGTGAIVRLPQCQWSKPGGMGKSVNV